MTDYIIDQIRAMIIPERYKVQLIGMLSALQTRYELDTGKTEANMYDVVEEHDNCHVQVLRNSVTGEISVGWRQDDEEEYEYD